jgi:acetaldehyde dehydrogenase (acetylating)
MLEDKDLVSIQEVRTKVEKAYAAWQKYRAYTQEQVDAIVERMAAAGRAQARRLAELAVEETGYGNASDKLAKNLLCADLLPQRMRGMKTVGIVREIPEEKLVEIAVPVGVVAAILPVTNPTSTVIYKTLISLKAGNAIVISPHPHAMRSTCETADVLYRAALEAGAPEEIIQCVHTLSLDGTHALMRHEHTGVILSTGGHGIVKAAYSSGKPAFGVGPGNVPVMIERSADVVDAINKVVDGKSFDYGTVCSSEQAIVVEEPLKDRVLAQLKARKAFLCNAAQKEALGKLLITPNWTINPKCVGQAPGKIARMAGFEVPADTSILVAELEGVGKQHPLSVEKLSPVLAMYVVKDFAAGLAVCDSLLHFGGLGHTCVIHSNDDARIREFALKMPANRVLVNTPAPQGSTGITTNVYPSMTLGCGAIAGNITSDNVGPQHLFNIKRLAYVARKAEEAFEYPAVDQPPAATAGLSGPVERQAVISAVERYLASRGIAPTPKAVAAASPAPAAVAASLVSRTTTEVVDRFLARRQGNPPACSTTPSSGGCGCGCSSKPEPSAAPAPSPVPAPPPKTVDFVCEEDVRVAMKESRKIFIGPKTIVTPSARELAERSDILVLAQS